MAIFYLPRIAASEFEEFKRLLDPCPADSHAAWLVLQARESAAIRADGHSVKLVDLDLDRFARYCARAGRRDIEAVRAFVFETATGKPY
jgi:hypothetical protein